MNPAPSANPKPSSSPLELEAQQLRTNVKDLKAEVARLNAELECQSAIHKKNVSQVANYDTIKAKNVSLQTTLNNMEGVLDELRDAMVHIENGNRSTFEAKQKDIRDLRIKNVVQTAKLQGKIHSMEIEMKALKEAARARDGREEGGDETQ
jgi:predicted RNase H-like nuclease (RuvC/YqgF family)